MVAAMKNPRELLDLSISEKDYQQQIIKLARLKGYLVYHAFYSHRSEYGFPDLVLVKTGCRLLFLEVKRENGKLTNAQREWMHRLQSAGVLARVVRPSDWKAVEKLLSNDDWIEEVG